MASASHAAVRQVALALIGALLALDQARAARRQPQPPTGRGPPAPDPAADAKAADAQTADADARAATAQPPQKQTLMPGVTGMPVIVSQVILLQHRQDAERTLPMAQGMVTGGPAQGATHRGRARASGSGCPRAGHARRRGPRLARHNFRRRSPSRSPYARHGRNRFHPQPVVPQPVRPQPPARPRPIRPQPIPPQPIRPLPTQPPPSRPAPVPAMPPPTACT